MQIIGNPVGVIQRQEGGYISCLASFGCESLKLEGINFSCDSTQFQTSSFRIQGTYLTISNSSFTGCKSTEDGGVIRSFDRSTVSITSSIFSNLHSVGFGGAIAAYGGSVFVVNSSFVFVSATRGGGALWSSAYQSCYGTSQIYNTVLEIKGSTFSNCTSKGNGGTILANSDHQSDASNSSMDNQTLSVEIHTSIFTSSHSSVNGGALCFSGFTVSAELFLVNCGFSSTYSGGAISADDGVSLALYGSVIHNNTAYGCGGAISANNSKLVLVDTVLNNNSALGFGGGAIFLKDTSFFANGTSCSGNRAPFGGGGVLLSQSSESPAPEVTTALCKQGNSAVYGSCMASDCKSLKIAYDLSGPVWAGLPFKLVATKLDAYQQIILIDNSFIQILSTANDQHALFSIIGSSVFQILGGNASFEVVIKPTFVEISPDKGVARVQAQPRIFVQSFDTQTGETIKSDVISINMEEGSNVCPQGYVLDLDFNQVGPGVCKLCRTDTYSVYPLTSSQGSPSCMICPAGAVCPDGSCVFHHNLSSRICLGGYRIVGDWMVDDSSKQLTLRGCPAGYYASAQQCEICPAAFYCTGGNVPSRPCASGSFAPAGAISSASCVPSVFVIVAVNIPIKRPEFKDDRVLHFQNALANATRWDHKYVTIKLIQAGEDPETTTITSDIVAPDAKEAAALVGIVRSSAMSTELSLKFGYYHASLTSVQVSSCVPGYELSLLSHTCQLCPANHFCRGGSMGREICPTDLGFSPPGADNIASCTSAVFVTLIFSIPIFKGNITDAFKSKVIAAISQTAGIESERVAISVGGTSRRAESSVSELITAKLAATNVLSAAALLTNIDEMNLNKQLMSQGLPKCTRFSISMPEISSESSALPTYVVVGISVGTIVLLAALSATGYCLASKIKKKLERAKCVAALSCAKAGTAASDEHLPLALRKAYIPDIILGNCAHRNGCVVRAKPKYSDQPKQKTNTLVAIKVVISPEKKFNGAELKQLRFEARMLSLLSENKCEYSARLLLGSGQGYEISQDICWYIMELLQGVSMETVINASHAASTEHLAGQRSKAFSLPAVECIHAARDVLAALKIVHDEGMLHLNIQPSNIFRCESVGTSESLNCKFTYKLIGFGTLQDINDTAAKKAVARTSGSKSIGAGTQPYMSPEMFVDPETATYPSDLWSLGITMFELITGSLPFQTDSGLFCGAAIAGNMAEKVPSLLDRISADRSSELESTLAPVVSKALEKEAAQRFSSADEMHAAVFGCLVAHCDAVYSVYLSYRAESDEPLAKFIFDELNHSRTPGGHRVTVFLGTCDGQGADVEDDFADGLLHSMCFFPILSLGATAPMAALPAKSNTQLSTMGEFPLGGTTGKEDREDAFLKVILIAGMLLEQSSANHAPPRVDIGPLCAAFPIFQVDGQQLGHSEYPDIGNSRDVHGGGGQFSMLPSPVNNKAAAQFLRDRVGLPVDMLKLVKERSVASAMSSLTKLQGCRLWDHAANLAEAELTREQTKLVGKGFAGPLLQVDGNSTDSTEQVAVSPLSAS